MYVAERKGSKQQEQIKRAIVNARDRGVCDSYGRSYPKPRMRQGNFGKGDRYRPVNKKRYDQNYVLAFGHE